MSKDRIALGKKGEELAVHFLQQHGFSIITRNYRQKSGEIDIIAKEGECLVFVEVKTRNSLQYGQPFEAVTGRKQMQLSKIALDYLTRNNLLDHTCRFDVVSIVINTNDKTTIEHLPNCFEFCAF